MREEPQNRKEIEEKREIVGMQIQKLLLQNFRNYESLSMEFSPGINILYGDNAQGKTNILEAIYLTATTKGIRNNKDKEMIRLGQESSHLCVFLEKGGIPHKIDMHLQAGKAKAAAIDGIRIKRSAELMGLMHTVSFSPGDLSMVKNGPSERRRFADMELCQLSPLYCSNLANYQKVLIQRNNLLHQIGYAPELKETIEVWDEQLVKYGKELIHQRAAFFEELSEIVKEKMKNLTGQTEVLEIFYEPETEAEKFIDVLKKTYSKDLMTKTTTHGPHRDDIRFCINKMNVRFFGSQGQQRTVVLALKLAEIELVRKKTGETPILLLDDVLSELDKNRQLQLLEEIKDVQTIVTCTGMEEVVNYKLKNKSQIVFYIENGTAKRKELL